MNPPEMKPLPAYMLMQGDMVWDPVRQWFFRCPYNAGLPIEMQGDDKPDVVVKIAPDTERARDWNTARRAAQLDGAAVEP